MGFRKEGGCEAFMGEFSGSITDFRNVMTAAFEDMCEIIR
jgi:hypothetical protein